ncbi:MAG: polyprenol monophosphomannose synthase [Lachnospiraceae bacterium]|nr:polyprenol monophosphomannose synthase [Lachnospiraceae bacterium]
MSKKLSIVVPTFNEAGNVEKLAEKIDEALSGIEHNIWFIDDSNDETPEVLKRLCEKNPNCRYHHREGAAQTGLATAVIEGFRMSDGAFLACMDADLQHPPEILRPMYAAMLSGADICIPSRLIRGGSDGGLDIVRKFVSGTARWMGKAALSSLRNISDPTSGLFMFRKDMLEGAELDPIGWKIMVEVLAMCRYSLVVEIPYEFHDRNSGESKISKKVTLQYIEQLASLRKRGLDHDSTIVTRWSPEFTASMVKKYCPVKQE